ncbi:hypothetical protein P3S68_018611 [Capsicum galapagoense]
MAKRRESTSSNPTIFSYDITIEIFSRLPVKSLMRFKCLSKFHNSLVSGSYLEDMLQRHSIISRLDKIKFFLPNNDDCYSIDLEVKKGEKVSTCYLDFDYDYLSYANGLFSLWEGSLERVKIFNPGTREVKLLPHILFAT